MGEAGDMSHELVHNYRKLPARNLWATHPEGKIREVLGEGCAETPLLREPEES
jgi:hypothetical protein